MDGRDKFSDAGVPTHCQYALCDAPIEQPQVGRRRFYCCDAHRIAANQEARSRNGRPAALQSVGGRRVGYGTSVLAVHQQFRAAVEGLQELAERLARELAQASDVRAAQAVVDQAESALERRERELVHELNAEIQARLAALDQVEEARDETASALQQAVEARASQANAETALEEARRTFEEAKAQLEAQLSAAQARESAAQEEARSAREAVSRSEHARFELEHRHAAELEHLRDERVQMRTEFNTRFDAVQQLANERDEQLREAHRELERERALAKDQREVLEVRLRTLEESAAERADELKRTRLELERARNESARDRELFEQKLAQEVLRGEARLREVREDLGARLQAVDEIAAERASALAEYRRQATVRQS